MLKKPYGKYNVKGYYDVLLGLLDKVAEQSVRKNYCGLLVDDCDQEKLLNY